MGTQRQQHRMKRRPLSRAIPGLVFLVLFALPLGHVLAQPPQCNPNQVVTANACAQCHTQEINVWRQTPHFKTFEQLHRNPRAKEISTRMGQRSIKRGDICIDCHYTTQMQNDKKRVVSGVSCESCHGGAKDWINIHSDYGGPTANKATESESHRLKRRSDSIAAGMRNPSNLYSIARSCFQCHTVPNEKLVNVGGHHAGSADFEFVAWSQGMVRHRFLSGGGTQNATNSQERLRIMFVVGLIADLEFSTRATAAATEKSVYGITSANRAASVAMKLVKIQEKIQDKDLEQVLKAFSRARLETNNSVQLNEIADEIGRIGMSFAQSSDGSRYAALDPLLPNPTTYR